MSDCDAARKAKDAASKLGDAARELRRLAEEISAQAKESYERGYTEGFAEAVRLMERRK